MLLVVWRRRRGGVTRSMRAKKGISCVVALLSMWLLVACDDNAPEDKSCAASCREKYPEGLRLLNGVIGICACGSCSDACGQSVCRDKESPSDECLPCVQQGLSTSCSNDGLFLSACPGDNECSDLIECIMACP